MHGFKDSFLNDLPGTISNVSGLLLNNFVLFVIVCVVALEIARRLPRFGALVASCMIVAAAIYATGASTYLVS